MRELKAEKAESSRLKVNSTTHIQLTTHNSQQTKRSSRLKAQGLKARRLGGWEAGKVRR